MADSDIPVLPPNSHISLKMRSQSNAASLSFLFACQDQCHHSSTDLALHCPIFGSLCSLTAHHTVQSMDIKYMAEKPGQNICFV